MAKLNGIILKFHQGTEKFKSIAFSVGETGPNFDSRGFSLISSDPLRQKCFFFTKVILYSCPNPLIFFNDVTSKL
jgi:hypothetical protein